MKKEDIKELIEFFNGMEMNHIKIKSGDFEVEVEKFADYCAPAKPVAQAAAPAPTPVNVVVSSEVKPAAHSPKDSQRVRKGDVVGIIEAMKIMNEIEAEFDCQITEMLVSDGQPVEFGLPLFGVEKN